MEPNVKAGVTDILKGLGLSHSDAINIFYNQIIHNNGLPFEVKIPNKTTLDAMKELEKGGGHSFNNVDEMIEWLEEDDED